MIPLGLLRLRAAPRPSLALLAAAGFGAVGAGLQPVIHEAGAALVAALWMSVDLQPETFVAVSTAARRGGALLVALPGWLLLAVGAWGFVRGAPAPAPPDPGGPP